MKQIIVAIIIVCGLAGSLFLYQTNEQKKIEQSLLLQQQIENERVARESREREEREARERREREERERLASLARQYGNQAGRQIMSSAGGGQDLRTNIKRWSYDRASDELEIQIEVYFNGAIFRSNTYNVDGILTVKRNGSNPRFSRTYANQSFRELESNMMWLGGIAAGVLILNELGNQ